MIAIVINHSNYNNNTIDDNDDFINKSDIYCKETKYNSKINYHSYYYPQIYCVSYSLRINVTDFDLCKELLFIST